MTKTFSIMTAVSAPLFFLFLAGCPDEEDQGPKVTSQQVCAQMNQKFNDWGHITVGQDFSILNDSVTVEPDESRISRCAETLKDLNQSDLRYISSQFLPCIDSTIKKKKPELSKTCAARAHQNMSEKGAFWFIELVFIPRLNEPTPNDLRRTFHDATKNFFRN